MQDMERASDEEILSGLGGFIDQVVVQLEVNNAELLEDKRKLYGANGGFSTEAQSVFREVRMASAEAGYYGMFAPSEIGGRGLGPILNLKAWEFMYHRYGPGRELPYQAISHWTTGPGLLCAGLTSLAREEILAGLMNGERTACFAMSEPDAGSDAWSMNTRAVKSDSGWILNGMKQWISSSPYADYVFVFAVTDEVERKEHRGGITCFLVPISSPGFRLDSVIRLFGDVGGNEGILSFTDVEVPDSYVVGELGRGFELALGGVSQGRMYNAGRCVGLARWALEQATSYAKERQTFGRAIADYQGISFQLAESAIDIYAAKTMSMNCAEALEAGENPTRNMAMVKAFTTEMCFRVYDRCIQVHGGMGLTNEMKLYDGWHVSRIIRIADGSAEIMRRNVARALLKGDVTF